MISDGFGDQSETVLDEEEILGNYHKWLHKVANDYLSATDASHDDLVQEGRIAMWKALSTFDPTKGALPTWLTGAARSRMKDMAFGHGQPTGREATRGKTEVKPVASVEAILEEGAEALLGAADGFSQVEVSYHHGEIWKALESLSPAQKRYVAARFWGGLEPSSREPAIAELRKGFPDVSKRYLWTGSIKQIGARDRLFEALRHLADA